MPCTGCAKRRLVPLSGLWNDLTGAARDVGRDQDLPDFVVTPRTPAEWVVASREILEADAVIVGSAPQILLRNACGRES